jgi:hypothetical protein
MKPIIASDLAELLDDPVPADGAIADELTEAAVVAWLKLRL